MPNPHTFTGDPFLLPQSQVQTNVHQILIGVGV